jgi:hypothetical protein
MFFLNDADKIMVPHVLGFLFASCWPTQPKNETRSSRAKKKEERERKTKDRQAVKKKTPLVSLKRAHAT